MTNELEKKFFDTFEIKPLKKNIPCSECEYRLEECGCFYCNREAYPQITDRILLELMCIHNQYLHPLTIYSTKKEFLKNNILECTIDITNYFYEHEMGEYSKLKHQVRTLFEE